MIFLVPSYVLRLVGSFFYKILYLINTLGYIYYSMRCNNRIWSSFTFVVLVGLIRHGHWMSSMIKITLLNEFEH